MNKGIWKLLTLVGFVLAVVAAGTILVYRFKLLDGFAGFSWNQYHPQTQQLPLTLETQLTTEKQALSDQNLDKKSFDRLQQGCLSGNDCIPSIDQPKFVSVREAKFMKEDDLVIGVAFEDSQKEDDPVKAYPVKIMNWHEVVNDFVNENPVVVTYSPLTLVAKVYGRMFDGKAVDFGVSGMLLNSNLVIYDRETKSLWNQFDGSALTGTKRNETLKIYPYPVEIVSWGEWVKKYPKTVVLSEDTGNKFSYNQYPYDDYEKNQDVYFPLEHKDGRLKPKDVVFGIVIGEQQKVYPQTELKKVLPNGGSFDDEFSGKQLQITFAKNSFSAVDTQTKERIQESAAYYFAWNAFYPNTQIYQAPVQENKAVTQAFTP